MRADNALIKHPHNEVIMFSGFLLLGIVALGIIGLFVSLAYVVG